MLHRLFRFFGIHLHAWEYFEHYPAWVSKALALDPEDKRLQDMYHDCRQCACGALQEHVTWGSCALGIESDWMDIEKGSLEN